MKSSSCYCEIEVDDLGMWQSFVMQQMASRHNKVVADFHEYCGSTWIYRGQKDSSWQISSSFERLGVTRYKNGIYNPERELRGKELAAIADFKARTWMDVPSIDQNNFSWLMLMRHHGVPTRLVDFTENAAIALYFALETPSDTDFAVWAIDRDAMRDSFSQTYIGKEFPGAKKIIEKYGERLPEILASFSKDDPDITKFHENETNLMLNEATVVLRKKENKATVERILDTPLNQDVEIPKDLHCLYVYPEFPTKRMLAQRGLFLVPIELQVSFMSQLLKSVEIDEDREPVHMKISEVWGKDVIQPSIIKFIFPREKQSEAQRLLTFANCTKETMYPDIDGVAQSIKEGLVSSLRPCKYLISTNSSQGAESKCVLLPPSTLDEKTFNL